MFSTQKLVRFGYSYIMMGVKIFRKGGNNFSRGHNLVGYVGPPPDIYYDERRNPS